MRHIFIILLFLSFASYGQSVSNFGATRPQDTSKTKGQIVATAYGILGDTAVIIALPNGTFKQVPIGDVRGSGGGHAEGYGINFVGNRIDVDTAEIPNYYYLTSNYFTQPDIIALLATKQNLLGYIPENDANKVNNLSSPNNTTYPTTQAVVNAIGAIPIDSPVYVSRVLIEGQSNVGGDADTALLTDYPLNRIQYNLFDTFNRVFISDTFGTYRPLKLGFNTYGDSPPRFGPELGLAMEWVKSNPSGLLFIDKKYQNGAQISTFLDGTTYATKLEQQRDSANKWLRARGLTPVDIGWYWNQGENDNADDSATYRAKLNQLYQDRLNAGLIDFSTRPMIVTMPATSTMYGAGVRAAQVGFANENRYARLQISDTIPLGGDNLHFNTQGLLQLGVNANTLLFDGEPWYILDTVNYGYILNQYTYNQPANMRISGNAMIDKNTCIGCLYDSLNSKTPHPDFNPGIGLTIASNRTDRIFPYLRFLFHYPPVPSLDNDMQIGIDGGGMRFYSTKGGTSYIFVAAANRIVMLDSTDGLNLYRLNKYASGGKKYLIGEGATAPYAVQYIDTIPQIDVAGLTDSIAALREDISSGGSFVPLSRNITINGVTQDLSADRTWTIPPTDTANLDYRIDSIAALLPTKLDTGSNSYIKNQDASAQVAKYRINGIARAARFWATDTVGFSNGEPAYNIERTLSSELTISSVGYNERSTILRVVPSNPVSYNAYLTNTNVAGSASGHYGSYFAYTNNVGVNVTDTLDIMRSFVSQGAINNSTGRVREWYGLYYQEPSGSGQIYDKHAAIRIQPMTKGTNRWAIQSYSTAPSNFLGNVGIGIATDTVPRRRLELGAGSTAIAPLGLNSGTALTTPIDGSLEYHSSHLYFTIGSTRYQLDQQTGGFIPYTDTVRSGHIATKFYTDSLFATSGGTGTVTSVALSTPSWLTVSGSPVTTSGTLAVTAATGQTANQFLATPDGSTGAVGLRAIVAADIPTLNQNTTGSAATLTTTRTIWGQNFNGSANVTGDITLGTGNITMTGSIAATGARVTKGWFTDIESTNVPTVGGVALPTASSTTTFTNKTLTSPIISSISNTGTLTLPTVTSTITSYKESNDASSATPTPVGDARQNKYYLTALATAPTFAAPSGTPANGNELLIRIKDNGTARALAWNAIYRGGTSIALPTTTTISKTMYVQFVYNSADSKWDLVGLTDGL